MLTYKKILEKYRNKTELADTVLESWKEPDDIFLISQEITGPILTGFVCWILKEAEKQKINTLYFLARDGYILYYIAKQLCAEKGLSIECRYLYCSRHSLRLATYHFIGNEAYELLLNQGYNLTACQLLQRVGFSEGERRKIYCQSGFENINEHAKLTKQELNQFRNQLPRNELYNKKIQEQSRTAYAATIGYLKQEGLLDLQTVAIVDSGWTGSMQRSLRQLLESVNYVEKIVGFYFGMFAQPKDILDGHYFTWYFDAKSKIKEKVLFCNNLFECMLSAPHGTTLTYKNENKQYYPVLKEFDSESLFAETVNMQIKGILSYSQRLIENLQWETIDLNVVYSMSEELLIRLMCFPTKQEVRIWSAFRFCDDITDNHTTGLINREDLYSLNQYLLLRRICNKLKKKTQNEKQLFWVWGAIAYLPSYKRGWFQLNFAIGEWLRYKLK